MMGNPAKRPLSSISPFHQWLRTSYIPQDSEVDQVKEFLERHLIRREVLATQIAEAKMIVDSLKEGRKCLQNAIDAHWGILHPVRQVPNHVWQKIFVYCLPTTHLPIMSATEMPLVLTQVCTLWRDIALSSPTLWSSLHITIPRGDNHRSHSAVTSATLLAVDRWLYKAVGEKLSISLHWPEDLIDDYGTRDEFPIAILQYSDAIRSLELNLPSDVLIDILDQSSSFSSLEEIIVRIPAIEGRSSFVGTTISHAAIWKVPTLRKVILESVEADIFDFPFVWAELEEITVSGDQPCSFLEHEEAFSVALASPMLQKLSIQLASIITHNDLDLLTREMSDGPNLFGLSTQVYLYHLTTLDISDIFANPRIETLSFIEKLQLPALEVLKYRLVELSPRAPHTDIHPLLTFLLAQRYPIKIKEWIVESTSMSRETFGNCLALMPQLRKLWIRDGRGRGPKASEAEALWLPEQIEREICPDDNIFDTFLPPPEDAIAKWSSISSPSLDNGGVQPVCPLLEKLRIDLAHCTLDGIRDFVQLRLVMGMTSSHRHPVVPLHDIQIGLLYPRPASDEVDNSESHESNSASTSRGRLETELVELGLRAKITFAPSPPRANLQVQEYVYTKPTDGLTISDSGFGRRSGSVGW